MFESVTSFITAVKEAGPKIYAAAFIASLLLLFLPASVIAQLGLADLIAPYRAALAIVLLVSGSLVAVHILFGGVPYAKSKLKNLSWRKAMREYLSTLTNAEKAFLRTYIRAGENTQYAPMHDGVAGGLVAKGIIYRASNFSVGGVPGVPFAFNLQHYARKGLTKHPTLLD